MQTRRLSLSQLIKFDSDIRKTRSSFKRENEIIEKNSKKKFSQLKASNFPESFPSKPTQKSKINEEHGFFFKLICKRFF